jgi:hypothetical protein
MQTNHDLRADVCISGRSASLRWVAVGCCAVFAALAAHGVVRSEVLDMYFINGGGPEGVVRKFFFNTETASATLDPAFATIGSRTVAGVSVFGPQTALVRNDNLYVSMQDSAGSIQVYNRYTGTWIEQLAAVPVATQIVWGPDKNGDGISDIYVTEWGGNISYVPTTGSNKGVVTNLVTGLGNTTYGLAISADQSHLYVGNRTDGTIRKYNTTDGSFTGQTISSVTNVGGMTISGTNLYATQVLTSGNHPLWQVAAGDLTGLTTFSSGFADAGYVLEGPDVTGDSIPDLFVGDSGNSRLVMVNRSTGATTNILTGYGNARSVVFAVPEPSCLLLAFVGGVAALSCGFVRKTRGRCSG